MPKPGEVTDTYKFDTPEQAQEFADEMATKSYLGIDVDVSGSTATATMSVTVRKTAAIAAAKIKRLAKEAPQEDGPASERTFKFETPLMAKRFATDARRITGAAVDSLSGSSVKLTFPKSSEGMLIRLWDKVSGVA